MPTAIRKCGAENSSQVSPWSAPTKTLATVTSCWVTSLSYFGLMALHRMGSPSGASARGGCQCQPQHSRGTSKPGTGLEMRDSRVLREGCFPVDSKMDGSRWKRITHPATATFLPSAGAELIQTFPPSAAPHHPARATAGTQHKQYWEPAMIQRQEKLQTRRRDPQQLCWYPLPLEKELWLLLALPGELGKAPVEPSDSCTVHTAFKAHR